MSREGAKTRRKDTEPFLCAFAPSRDTISPDAREKGGAENLSVPPLTCGSSAFPRASASPRETRGYADSATGNAAMEMSTTGGPMQRRTAARKSDG